MILVILGITWFSTRESRKVEEELKQVEIAKSKTQLKKLLDMRALIDDVELTNRAAAYAQEVKDRVRNRISAARSILVSLISTVNNSESVQDYRLLNLETQIHELIEICKTGDDGYVAYTKPTTTALHPNMISAHNITEHEDPVLRSTYNTPYQPPTRVVETHVIQNTSSSSDLLTGILIGDMLSNHSHHDSDEYRESSHNRNTARYEEPETYAATSNSWDDDTTTKSTASDSWDDNSSNSSNDSYSDTSSSSSDSSSSWD